MDKGQHLRLLLSKNTGSQMTKQVIALATDMTFHVSVQTELSTTKDSTDLNGMWDEYEKTGISYDFQIGALIGYETNPLGADKETANTLSDIIDGVSDTELAWDLAVVEGDKNRTIREIIASGMGKLSNVKPSGQNRQNAQYTATLNGYGPYDVAE